MSSFRPNITNYKDFDFDFEKNDLTGDIKIKLGLSSISQSIKNIILTSPGERPFSNIGGDLYSTILENSTDDEFVIIKQKIIGVLSVYEPRIFVDYNDIDLIRENTGGVRINIRYAVVEGLGINSKQTINLLIE